jgi:dienelactone hydrolase
MEEVEMVATVSFAQRQGKQLQETGFASTGWCFDQQATLLVAQLHDALACLKSRSEQRGLAASVYPL